MTEINITTTGTIKGDTVIYPVIIRNVLGLRREYGPGGFGLGIVPAGCSGRQETGGPIVAGPWGFVYGKASIIDNHGGTAADLARARAEGRLIDQIENGDVLVIGGTRFIVRVDARGQTVDLVAEVA